MQNRQSKVDLIVQKAIIDKQYDIMQLNVILFKYTNVSHGQLFWVDTLQKKGTKLKNQFCSLF